MRIRRLLLIHPSRSTRGLIKKYVYSELSDVEIFEAMNGRQALDQMAAESFDIVASTDRLDDMCLTELKTGQQTTQSNGRTPLIIISESESNHVRTKMAEQGFDRVVQIRMKPADLIHNINALCDPRQWRQDARYHIPGLAVTIHLRHVQIQAGLINISMGGILVELAADHPEFLMTGPVHISLQLPVAKSLPGIEDIKAKVLRLETIQWRPDLTPAVLRATFIFYDLDNGSRSRLEDLIQMDRADKITVTEIED